MLQKLNFKPGFNKQDTESGAEGQWTDGDFVRFRYGLPEKIGGWNQLTAASKTLPGAARKQHAFTSFAGEKYTAIGTSQGLFLYYGNDFFDITPLDTAITGCTITTVNGSNIVTINKGSHGLAKGRYITLSGVTVTGASDYTAAELEKVYEIQTTPDVDKLTILASRNEGGSGMTAAGAATVNPYVEVGPTFQTAGYGWGTEIKKGDSLDYHSHPCRHGILYLTKGCDLILPELNLKISPNPGDYYIFPPEILHGFEKSDYENNRYNLVFNFSWSYNVDYGRKINERKNI